MAYVMQAAAGFGADTLSSSAFQLMQGAQSVSPQVAKAVFSRSLTSGLNPVPQPSYQDVQPPDNTPFYVGVGVVTAVALGLLWYTR